MKITKKLQKLNVILVRFFHTHVKKKNLRSLILPMVSFLPAAREKVIIDDLTVGWNDFKHSITLLKTSTIIHMWSLSIKDRTKRISHKCVNKGERQWGNNWTFCRCCSGSSEEEVLIEVWQWVPQKQIFVQNIKFIFIAAFLFCRVEKEEKRCSKFHCCWRQVACFLWHPFCFSVIKWSSPSHGGTERTASLHTLLLPSQYLSQINDVVQGLRLTTCAWTQFPHG